MCAIQHQETPLHFASRCDMPDVARDLIEAGADINALDGVRCIFRRLLLSWQLIQPVSTGEALTDV